MAYGSSPSVEPPRNPICNASSSVTCQSQDIPRKTQKKRKMQSMVWVWSSEIEDLHMGPRWDWSSDLGLFERFDEFLSQLGMMDSWLQKRPETKRIAGNCHRDSIPPIKHYIKPPLTGFRPSQKTPNLDAIANLIAIGCQTFDLTLRVHIPDMALSKLRGWLLGFPWVSVGFPMVSPGTPPTRETCRWPDDAVACLEKPTGLAKRWDGCCDQTPGLKLATDKKWSVEHVHTELEILNQTPTWNS